MTKDEALKMAIEALENSLTIQDVAINACKEALELDEIFKKAYAKQAEKVKVLYEKNGIQTCEILPAPSWQGLTDDDVTDLVNFWNISDIEIAPFIEMVVRKLKDKNT